jgi:predicted transcriptional regulator
MFKYTSSSKKKIDPRRLKSRMAVVSYLSKEGRVEEKKDDLCGYMGLTRATFYNRLRELVAEGLVVKYQPQEWASGVGLEWVGGGAN